MNRVVVDTNIVFSTFLNANSRIGQIILNGGKYYDFYAPAYIRVELMEHKDRIKDIGKLGENAFVELFELIVRNVHVLNHSIVPTEYYVKALKLCEGIDIEDTAFVAVTDYVRGRLWTGDKALINGLTEKGYNRLLLTGELYQDFLIKNKGSK